MRNRDPLTVAKREARVWAVACALILLALLPWFDTSRVKSCSFRPVYKWLVIIFVINVIFLGYLGGKPAEGWYTLASQIATFWYFFHIIILTPLVGWFEKPAPLPASISEPVLNPAAAE